MRSSVWLAACVLVLAAVGVASADQGSVRGVVTSVATVQGDDGKMIYTVTLKGEGPWQAVLSVGPENKAAYELVAGLKPGERVAVGWTTDGGKTWIREIVRDTRTEGRRTEAGTERTAGEGEVRKEGGDREAAEREARAKAERERAYQEARARAEREKVEAEGRKEGGDREAAEREARAKAERDRAYKEERARAEKVRAEAEGRAREIREGERREGERTDRPALMKTMARVISVETGEGNARVIKLAAVESGEEMSFTVRVNQTDLYNQAGNLKAGSTVRVAWRTEAGKPVLTSIYRVGDER